MPQFFPDGPSAVNLNNISEQGGINIPMEPSSMYDTPGLQGSMQQLLSENLGKFVLADFLVGVSTVVRRVGILYSVGRGFLVIYNEDYHTFQVCDIFSLKFISFFPPGSEPTIEELLSGEFVSGILGPGIQSGILTPGPNTGVLTPMEPPNAQGMGCRGGNSGGVNGMNGARPGGNSGGGHRTLGMR